MGIVTSGDRIVVSLETGSTVAIGLTTLVEQQGDISGRVPGALDGSRESLVAYAYGLTEELHEAVREVGWKPWKDPTPPNVERVVEETADILAFLGIVLINLAKACEMDPTEFVEQVGNQYQDTCEKNRQRFENGREAT